MKALFFALFVAIGASAQVLVSPVEAMAESFSANTIISKKNILLSKKEALAVQKRAGVKLDTKIYRIYIAKKKNKALGYGILINKKVRSKNAVVLYVIKDGLLEDIEIIAFNEPREYLPTKAWLEQFKQQDTKQMLKLNREVASITGATLSARSVTQGSRIAFALYAKILITGD